MHILSRFQRPRFSQLSMSGAFYCFYLIGLLSAGSSVTFAQVRDTIRERQAPQNDQFLPRLKRAKTVLSEESVEVPLQELLGHPFVQVMINGKGPFRFGVETGAAFLVMTPKVAHTIGADSTNLGKLFVVDSLRIGGAQFQNLSAVTMSGSLAGLDGLLGLSVYYDLLTTIDVAHGYLRFTRGSLPVANGKDILDLQTIANQIYGTEMWIDSVQVIAALDTQNDRSFGTVPSLVADTHFVTPPITTGMARGVGIGKQLTRSGRLKGHIRVAGTIFQQPFVSIIPMPYPALQRWNVGWNTLRHFTLTLDQLNRRIRLSSPVTSVPPPPPDSGFVKFDLEDSIITAVFPLRPEAEPELEVGDVLISINDSLYSAKKTAEEFQTFLRTLQRGRDPIRMVVRRGGVTKEIVLTRQLVVP